MKRLRNLMMALTFTAAVAGGSISDAAPLARIKRDLIATEVRDAGGRTWSFTPTDMAVRRYGPSFEL